MICLEFVLIYSVWQRSNPIPPLHVYPRVIYFTSRWLKMPSLYMYLFQNFLWQMSFNPIPTFVLEEKFVVIALFFKMEEPWECLSVEGEVQVAKERTEEAPMGPWREKRSGQWWQIQRAHWRAHLQQGSVRSEFLKAFLHTVRSPPFSLCTALPPSLSASSWRICVRCLSVPSRTYLALLRGSQQSLDQCYAHLAFCSSLFRYLSLAPWCSFQTSQALASTSSR